ncbi:unnamed protein product [Heligmosomoides polygyrus]|uniref:Secreted protein n=1 Tax=Heligmosomoides polygyrus TaxID=6339 RepID=A0A183G2W3_HELPZ|nr:unnamed protein product [Heligmosomoides polygyrus]
MISVIGSITATEFAVTPPLPLAPQREPPPKQSKPDLYQKKVVLYCWWNSQEMFYHELTTVTANIYDVRQQHLSEAEQRK